MEGEDGGRNGGRDLAISHAGLRGFWGRNGCVIEENILACVSFYRVGRGKNVVA